MPLSTLKGKDKPIKFYESFGYKAESMEGKGCQFIVKFEEGLTDYRNQNWQKAKFKFEEALCIEPTDRVSKLYISRCSYYKENELPQVGTAFGL